MSQTPTAATPTPTPEELATITIRYRLPKSEAQAMMQDERARQICWGDVFAERDEAETQGEAQRAEIERLTKELAREEAICGDIIDQREAAEKALSDLFSMVTGRPPEWSNLFGYSEALDECEEALAASQERERVMREALETVVIAADEVTRAKGRSASVRGASDQKRRNMEEWVLRATVALENALMFARAALQPQEAADER